MPLFNFPLIMKRVNPSSKFFILHETSEYIYIVDTGVNEKSITNDAEAVVSFLAVNHHLDNRRLIYRDSSGQRDEILHENGKFLKFAPGYKGIPFLPNYDDVVPVGETDVEKLAEQSVSLCRIFVRFIIESRYFLEPIAVYAIWNCPFLPRVGETVSGWLWIESKYIKLERFYNKLSNEGEENFKKSKLDFVNWLYEVSTECDHVAWVSYFKDDDDIIPYIGLTEES